MAIAVKTNKKKPITLALDDALAEFDPIKTKNTDKLELTLEVDPLKTLLNSFLKLERFKLLLRPLTKSRSNIK